MRLHSVTDAITNSSSEIYTFPRFIGREDVLREMMDALWCMWVEENPDEFLGWARWFRVKSGYGLAEGEEEAGNDADAIASLASRCPLGLSVDPDDVPSVYVHMTGNDSPFEFDQFLLSMTGGLRSGY